MKHLVLLLALVTSNFTLASVHVDIDFDQNGKMHGFSSDVVLDKKETINFGKDNLKVEYTLSNKRPANYPSDFEWTKESISLVAKVIDIKKNKVIASPEVTTVYGQEAVIEMIKNKKSNSSDFKISFRPSKKSNSKL